jgi:hypothetical protein
MAFITSARGAKILGVAALAVGVAVLAGSPTACSNSQTIENPCGTQRYCETKLTLLHTGDVHSRLFPYL